MVDYANPFDPNDPPLRGACTADEWQLACEMANHAYSHSIEPAFQQHLSVLHAANPSLLLRLACATVINIRTIGEIHRTMGDFAAHYPDKFSEGDAAAIFKAARAEITVAFDVLTASFFEGVRKEKAHG